MVLAKIIFKACSGQANPPQWDLVIIDIPCNFEGIQGRQTPLFLHKSSCISLPGAPILARTWTFRLSTVPTPQALRITYSFATPRHSHHQDMTMVKTHPGQ